MVKNLKKDGYDVTYLGNLANIFYNRRDSLYVLVNKSSMTAFRACEVTIKNLELGCEFPVSDLDELEEECTRKQ